MSEETVGLVTVYSLWVGKSFLSLSAMVHCKISEEKKTFLNYMVSDRIIYMGEKGPSFIKPRRLWRTIFWWNI